MREEGTKYKLVDGVYHFCYYDICDSIHNDETYYCIDFNKGQVGTIPNFDCGTDFDYITIEKIKEEILDSFTITEIPLHKIDLNIKLEDALKNASKKEKSLLTKRLTRSIDYVCKCSGLGLQNFITPLSKSVLQSLNYQTVIYVYDKNSFRQELHENIRTLGISDDEIITADLI